MSTRKRGSSPDEAPTPANKRPRAQHGRQIDNTAPPPNLQRTNVVDSGRPGSPFDRVPQAGSHQTPPAQIPPEQINQEVRARPRLILRPPRLPDQPGPGQAGPNDPGSSHSETSTCYSQDVSHYDVDQSVSAFGWAEVEDISKWKKGAAEFIRSTSGLDGNWVGIRPLGKEGNGIAGLWEWQDENGQTTKQMVVKEESHGRDSWGQIPESREVPREVKAMSKMNKAGCYAIPRLFNYKRYPLFRKHRMYMEFCPFKDLSVLCNRYRRFRQYLPEAFLWDTFHHLVEAAVAMRDGPPNNKWDFEMVHLDLKPSNYFLGPENEEKGFPFYPVAKTGDFGLAVMTNPDDPSNPLCYRDCGTDGYRPPEQEASASSWTEQVRLSSYTNVWAIGATMLELLTLYKIADYLCDPKYSRNGEPINIETNKDPEYSEDIRELIQECVRVSYRHRPNLDVLQTRINAHLAQIQNAYEQADDEGKAKFRSDSRLYYVGSQINDMETGNWAPDDPKKKPKRERWPEGPPIIYPKFDDGPESGEEDDDSDEDDSDDDEDGDGNPFKARRTVQQPQAPAPQPPRPRPHGRLPRREIPDSQPGREITAGEIAAGAGAGDGGILPFEPFLHKRRSSDLTDGMPDHGSDDGSQKMDEENSDPPSPPPPAPPAPVQGPAQPPAHPAAQAPAPAQPPAQQPVVQPVVQPVAQPPIRRLRNGKVVPYFS